MGINFDKSLYTNKYSLIHTHGVVCKANMVSSWYYFILPIVLLIGLLRKCRERTWGKCKNTDSLLGRVFIVTGANSGIGKETVKELAKRKATVILACRYLQTAQNAISDIRTQISTGKLVILIPNYIFLPHN